MSSSIESAENLMVQATFTRSWNGVRVEVTEYGGTGPISVRLPHEDVPRLGVILEEAGGSAVEPRFAQSKPCPITHRPRDMHYSPAGMELWAHSDDLRYAKDVNICFDMARLSQQLEASQIATLGAAPRLRFTDDRVWHLVKLLAETVPDMDPSTQLYGDSLALAIAAQLFRESGPVGKVARGLSTLQLKDAIDLLQAQMPSRVDLTTLAGLAGVSPSHYCRAFKTSTGLAPYQWQLNARIERAKCLLVSTSCTLEDIAEATGFADSVHFGRTFRKLVGASPAAWRSDRFA